MTSKRSVPSPTGVWDCLHFSISGHDVPELLEQVAAHLRSLPGFEVMQMVSDAAVDDDAQLVTTITVYGSFEED